MTRFLNWLRGLWWRNYAGRSPREVADEYFRATEETTIVPRGERGCGFCLLVVLFGTIILVSLVVGAVVIWDWVKELL